MGKYDKETFGRAEAVFNKLGGEVGVEMLLSPNGSDAGLTTYQRAYMSQSNTPRVLRDLFRGWGNYETKEQSGDAVFNVLLHNITDRTINTTKSLVQKDNTLTDEVVQKNKILISDWIEVLKLLLVEFRAKEGVPLKLGQYLDTIKLALRHDQDFAALQAASELKGYIAGVEWFTKLLRPE